MKIFFSFIVLFAAFFSIAQEDNHESANYAIFDDIDPLRIQKGRYGLLHGEKDLFANAAGFRFRSGKFRVRGTQSESSIVCLNGVKMNDPESGWAKWSLWGGLNHVAKYPEDINGLGLFNYNFGGLTSSSNLSFRATDKRDGTYISYAHSNRTYTDRLMVTHSTGLMDNGWALVVSASKRYAKEGYVPGTNYNAHSYFLAAEKKLNNKHSLNLAAFGAQRERGAVARGSIQEAYDLTGDNFYNPNWGMQNGEVRNAVLKREHTPVVMLSHYFNINSSSKLTTSAFYKFGTQGRTNLNWYEARDPRPIYYKYFPSYFEEENNQFFDGVTNDWQTDVNTQQLNWEQLYFANSKNLFELKDADGQEGNDLNGIRSKYIVEYWKEDPKQVGLSTNYFNTINERLNVSGGFDASIYKNRKYKILEDLLVTDEAKASHDVYWVDVDQFAERDADNDTLFQNDLSTFNKTIREGDAFGYDYVINVNNIDAFGTADYRINNFDFYGSLNLAATSFWRTGNLQNGRFPDNSLGDSERQNFLNYGIKGGVVYKLTSRHLFNANATYFTKAPNVRNSYISPRTRDFVVNDLKSTKTLSGDFNYFIRYPNFKTRATYFYTEIKDQVWYKSFYHDQERTFVNYTMNGVDNLYHGIEFASEVTIKQLVSLIGVFGTGQNVYNSRPTAIIANDNSSEVLAENRTIYLQNYRTPGPQTISSLEVKYNGAKNWFGGISGNYFADIYSEVNPDRRTDEALAKYVDSDPQVSDILDQEILPNYFTLDAFIFYRFRIKVKEEGTSEKMGKYYFTVNFNVSNILNDKNIRTQSLEQLRYDVNDIHRFPSRYRYMNGRTYFLQLNLRF